ncbi:hypothetical protein ACN5FX_10505 [Klebsiella pneumoniae]|uniref:hypothetical protein n=1 Tax=Klebsiella pneumoniae TaxID=573 RepID=UPI003AF4DA21
MSILTKEVIQKILNDDWLLMDDCEGLENCTVIKELARMALAAMDSEPVAWTDEQELRDVEKDGCGYLFKANPITPNADPRRVILLYRHAQPVPECEPVKRVNADQMYVMVPAKANIAMIRAGGKAAREYMEQYGGNSPQVIYQAMLAAAPQEVK